MGYLNVDEHIKKKRKEEKLFQVKKDSKTGCYVSFPTIKPNEDEED